MLLPHPTLRTVKEAFRISTYSTSGGVLVVLWSFDNHQPPPSASPHNTQ
jgi:hypothetical protein